VDEAADLERRGTAGRAAGPDHRVELALTELAHAAVIPQRWVEWRQFRVARTGALPRGGAAGRPALSSAVNPAICCSRTSSVSDPAARTASWNRRMSKREPSA